MNDFISTLGYKVDNERLFSEYTNNISHKMNIDDATHLVVVQKYCYITIKDFRDPILDKMPYTRGIINLIAEIAEFDKIVYRIVMPNTCYSWHIDSFKNGFSYHIPLVSNDGCLFVYESINYKMPADGSIYKTKNDIPHTFINSGKTERLHLMFENVTQPS